MVGLRLRQTVSSSGLMETYHRTPAQPVGEHSVETNGWRAQLTRDSRDRIVNKIFETLMRCVPVFGPVGVTDLRKAADRFEESVFRSATSLFDYLRKISLKMISMENKYQNIASGSVPTGGSLVDSSKPPESSGNSADTSLRSHVAV